MKYLFLMMALCVGPAHALVKQTPAPQQYEITDDDCSALNDVARGVTMMRDEGIPIETVKARIKSGDNMKRKEFVALLPNVMKIVDTIYDKQRVRKTPSAEAEEVFMSCMDHIYAGTDF